MSIDRVNQASRLTFRYRKFTIFKIIKCRLNMGKTERKNTLSRPTFQAQSLLWRLWDNFMQLISFQAV